MERKAERLGIIGGKTWQIAGQGSAAMENRSRYGKAKVLLRSPSITTRQKNTIGGAHAVEMENSLTVLESMVVVEIHA